jgi:hypothetical protein
MKSSWEKPEMIVLVKQKSDEEILADCKVSSGNATNYDGFCLVKKDGMACHG